jgi:hypothetical protein
MAFPLSDEEHNFIESMIQNQIELVVAAAIKTTGGLILMVERPGRHGECISLLHWSKLPYENQGFITNKGRFVDRKEAAEIVMNAKQGSPRVGSFNPNNLLYSEDMWNG